MTEADARVLLHNWPSAGGLRISASAPGDGDPAVWIVTG